MIAVGDIVEVINAEYTYPRMAYMAPECIEWPSEDIKRQCSDRAWRGWQPARGMLGEAIHVVRHCRNDSDVVIVEFEVAQPRGERRNQNPTYVTYYAPIDEHGLTVKTPAPQLIPPAPEVTFESLRAIPALSHVDDHRIAYVAWLLGSNARVNRSQQWQKIDTAIEVLGFMPQSVLVGNYRTITPGIGLEVVSGTNQIKLIELLPGGVRSATRGSSRYDISSWRSSRPHSVLLGELELSNAITPFQDPEAVLAHIQGCGWLQEDWGEVHITEDAPTEWSVTSRNQTVLTIDLIEKLSPTEDVEVIRNRHEDESFSVTATCNIDMATNQWPGRLWSTDAMYWRDKAPLTYGLLYAMYGIRYPNNFTLYIRPKSAARPIWFQLTLHQQRNTSLSTMAARGMLTVRGENIYDPSNDLHFDRSIGGPRSVANLLSDVSETLNEMEDRRRGVT